METTPEEKKAIRIKNAAANINIVIPENETLENIVKTDKFVVLKFSKKMSVFAKGKKETEMIYDYFSEATESGLYYDKEYEEDVDEMLELIERKRESFVYVSGYEEFIVIMSLVIDPNDKDHFTILHTDFNNEMVTKMTICVNDLSRRVCENFE
jgi:hypothetical protein